MSLAYSLQFVSVARLVDSSMQFQVFAASTNGGTWKERNEKKV